MSKKAKTAPIPDYEKLGEKTTASQRSTVKNPWGEEYWYMDTNSPSGWAKNTTLNPMDQQNLDSYRGLQGQMMGLAGNTLGNYFSNGGYTSQRQGGDAGNFKMGKLPDLADPSFNAVKEVQDAMMSRMVPDMERARKAQEAQLIAQGVGGNTGSEAWDRSQEMIGRNENDQRQQAVLGAMGAYNDIFNRSLANRNQMANEQLGAGQINAGLSTAAMQDRTSNAQFNKSQDFKDMMALLAGVQAPTMPNFGPTGGTDYLAAGNQQYNALQNQYNAQNAAKSSMFGNIAGIAGSMMGGPFGAALGKAIF
jgi:hypothetical protein